MTGAIPNFGQAKLPSGACQADSDPTPGGPWHRNRTGTRYPVPSRLPPGVIRRGGAGPWGPAPGRAAAEYGDRRPLMGDSVHPAGAIYRHDLPVAAARAADGASESSSKTRCSRILVVIRTMQDGRSLGTFALRHI